ncbi:Protein CBG12226 [Caenorhabditis briggsae]|uniref:Protein CBG12226 n=2 Tax=Caenorhabditis briggsae TaxID=6238 RepID=A8XEY2_CAEBR|nr:Protein CBG12226 [Caenorhabditis briggsae]CAP31204.1 Protein CBG12226 [Caenorhabditis briggsae]
MRFTDYSFEFNQEPIHFSVTSHSDKDLVSFNWTGRIGQVIEVIQPPELLSSQLSERQRVEYELKNLLGNSELPGVELFIRRFVIHFAEKKQRRSLLFVFGIGLDGITNECIAAALRALESSA